MTEGSILMHEQVTRRIYVALLDGGNDAWQIVDAIHEGNDAYRILSTNTHPRERWEYNAGERVRCRATILPSGERVLVATERLPARLDEPKS